MEVVENNKPIKLEIVALDGYPLSHTRDEREILIPPAGRAEFIVQAPAAGGSAVFYTQAYSTGPTGNPDIQSTSPTSNSLTITNPRILQKRCHPRLLQRHRHPR